MNAAMSFTAVMVYGRWQPGIGDPDALDWTITALYFVACGVCLRAGWVEWRAVRRGAFDLRPAFWLGLAVALYLLGCNKQLDLQSAFIAAGRDTAVQQGWYEKRRAFQAWFIVAAGACGILGIGAVGWWMRRVWRTYLFALAGAAVLMVFVLV